MNFAFFVVVIVMRSCINLQIFSARRLLSLTGQMICVPMLPNDVPMQDYMQKRHKPSNRLQNNPVAIGVYVSDVDIRNQYILLILVAVVRSVEFRGRYSGGGW